jgi:DNA-binding CsgD family transcriptional regulator/tetratricopeptide (TPR) repeat protein
MLFRRLSVFNGGWSLEAAEAVCSGDGLEPDDILDALAKLVDRSLVLVEGRETVARYTLLETLRQYAHEKLSDAGEETTLRHRHLAWCVSLAEQAAPRLKTADQTAWLHVLEREQDNFRSALSWSLQIGRVELCLRLLVASAYFFEIRGHRYRAEGLRWLEQAVSHPKAGTGPISLRAEALYWAGTYAGELCQFSSATRLLEKSLSLWQEIGDLRGMAEALLSVGVAARVRGDYERASTALDKAFGLMQERSDELGIAQAQRQRGILARVLGQFEIAESQTVEALHIFERLGELHQVGHAEAELGEVARAKGARERAAELLTLGAGLLAEAGCEEGVSAARYVQACLAHDEGNAAVAWARAVEALRVARDGGARRDTPRCLELLALLSMATDPRRSASLLGAADSVRTAFGIALHPIDQAIYDRAIADARGRLSEASFAEAWNAGCAMGTPPGDVFTYALETPVQAVASLQKRAPGDLTPRECEVAALVSRGFSNRQIAEALVITERTAEAHVTHILDKLGLRSRAQLAVWAVERNLS